MVLDAEVANSLSLVETYVYIYTLPDVCTEPKNSFRGLKTSLAQCPC